MTELQRMIQEIEDENRSCFLALCAFAGTGIVILTIILWPLFTR